MKIAVLFYFAFQFCYAKRQILFPRSEFFRSKLCPGLSPDLDCGKFNVSSIWQFQGINLRRCDDFHWCKIRAIQEVSADSLAWENQKIQRGCFQLESFKRMKKRLNQVEVTFYKTGFVIHYEIINTNDPIVTNAFPILSLYWFLKNNQLNKIESQQRYCTEMNLNYRTFSTVERGFYL